MKDCYEHSRTRVCGLCVDVCFISPQLVPKSYITRLHDKSMCNRLRYCPVFSQVAVSFCILITGVGEFQLSHILTVAGYYQLLPFFFSNLVFLVGVQRHFAGVLT